MTFSITLIIVIITVMISYRAFQNPEFQYKLIHNPYRVAQNKEYYRFLTSGLIHSDYMHLGFNMFTLFFFGNSVERYYQMLFGGTMGGILFVLLYVLGIIMSDLPTFFKYKNIPNYNSLGASGGVSAVIFSSILFQPINQICFYFVLCLPGFVLGGLYILYSATMAKQSMDRINHNAHLYGALFGIAFSIALYPSVLVSFFYQISQWKGFF